jgi:hypothetical protein
MRIVPQSFQDESQQPKTALRQARTPMPSIGSGRRLTQDRPLPTLTAPLIVNRLTRHIPTAVAANHDKGDIVSGHQQTSKIGWNFCVVNKWDSTHA